MGSTYFGLSFLPSNIENKEEKLQIYNLNVFIRIAKNLQVEIFWVGIIFSSDVFFLKR
jgi:hypothetical protein